MEHVHLVVPGLFPPHDVAAEVCHGLRLPTLEKLLARADHKVEPPVPLEDYLCRVFGVEAVAPVRALADGLDVSSGYWMCADPVNLELQRAQMILVPEVGIAPEEASALCEALNAYFVGRGMQFFAPHPQRWYLRLEQAPVLATFPLRQVAWQDAHFLQPQGMDGLYWQGVLTELQMLMYGHPVNQAREARRERLVSSVWLWGGGYARQPGRPCDRCGGESALFAAFAAASGVPWSAALPELLEGSGESGVWVWETLEAACWRGDWDAWRHALQQVEAACAMLLPALWTGRLRRLSLWALQQEGMYGFGLTRAASLRFWRTARPLVAWAM